MAHKERATSSPIVTGNTVRTYMGINIWPADPNGSGIRFEATTREGKLRSDSLDGIKRLIREALKKSEY